MKQCLERIQNDSKYAIGWMAIAVVSIGVFGSLFLLSKTITEVGFWDKSDEYPTSTISVEGTGEVVAVPDIATFTFSVDETSESVESAQNESAKKMNSALDYLKSQNIDEKDIKTTGYNLYPRYEYIPCVGIRCIGGEQKLVGYQVLQHVTVKVRETSKVGKILSGVGQLGVTNISGPSFTTDDPSVLIEEARSKAVANAREKAEKLAKDLDVKLKGVVSFNEYGAPTPFGYGGDVMMESSAMNIKAVAPEIPVGENTTRITVNVTYEID